MDATMCDGEIHNARLGREMSFRDKPAEFRERLMELYPNLETELSKALREAGKALADQRAELREEEVERHLGHIDGKVTALVTMPDGSTAEITGYPTRVAQVIRLLGAK